MYVILSTLRMMKVKPKNNRDKREISPKKKRETKTQGKRNKQTEKNLNKFKNKFEKFQRLHCVSVKDE